MNERSALRERANQTAQRHFESCETWPTSVLIHELETLAYEIAREGDNDEVTGLFVLVADLSAQRTNVSNVSIDANVHRLQETARAGQVRDL